VDGLILPGKDVQMASAMFWLMVFCEVCESRDEPIINVSVICSRGLTKFYCVCVIMGYGQTDKGFLQDKLIVLFYPNHHAKLPHNNVFYLVTAAFIQK
jgi:hypothetical protein